MLENFVPKVKSNTPKDSRNDRSLILAGKLMLSHEMNLSG